MESLGPKRDDMSGPERLHKLILMLTPVSRPHALNIIWICQDMYILIDSLSASDPACTRLESRFL